MKWSILLVLIASTFLGVAQKPAHLRKPSDSLKGEAFLNTVEQSLKLFYADYTNDLRYKNFLPSQNISPFYT